MNKKLVVVLLVLMLSNIVCFSFETDLWDFMNADKYYVELKSSYRRGYSYNEVLDCLKHVEENSSEESLSKAKLVRAYSVFISYVMSYSSEKHTDVAKQYLEKSYSLLEDLKNNNIDEYYTKSLEFLVYSSDYLITKNVSKGLKGSKAIDYIYEKYPQDLSIMLLYAAKIMNAPSIAGGDCKKALEIYEDILKYENKISESDAYYVYYGIGNCALKLKDSEKAKTYLNIALDLYSEDPDARKCLKQLKNQ